MRGMNKLPSETRVQILGMMVEGMSMRAIARLTGASKNTIVKFLRDAGEACASYQDEHLRNLTCKRIQVDEICKRRLSLAITHIFDQPQGRPQLRFRSMFELERSLEVDGLQTAQRRRAPPPGQLARH